MKTQLFKSLLAVLVIIVFTACSNCPQETSGIPIPDNESDKSNVGDKTTDANLIPLAKTITYDVLIRNPNEEDSWATECLKDMDATKLVDMIFEAVYAGKITAISVLYDEPMTIEDVKEIESREDYSRELVGKIQFVEEWKINKNTLEIIKEVKQILPAYEKYDNSAQVIGYTATFYVRYNDFVKAVSSI